MRFKNSSFFLFSFPFKLSALLSQQAVLNTNISLDSPFLFSPFFFLSFFFFFILLFFFLLEKESKSTHSFTVDETNLFSFFLSFFEYRDNFQYLGRVEGKAVLVVLIFSNASSQVPFFYGRAAFSRIWLKAPFAICPTKNSALLFSGALRTWRPSLANVFPELKILFAGEGPPGVWL